MCFVHVISGKNVIEIFLIPCLRQLKLNVNLLCFMSVLCFNVAQTGRPKPTKGTCLAQNPTACPSPAII